VVAGRCRLILSALVLAELDEVLRRPKFRRYLSEDAVRVFVTLVAGHGTLHQDAPTRAALSPDPDDDYLLALAHAASTDYLISGDAHLTGLANTQPPVLTPRAFLDLLSSHEPAESAT
jgi:putative PIN family toxin of toxin-antitoxin system